MAITIGLKTDTHIFICAERTVASSIVKVKETENRIDRLHDTLICVSGEPEDELRVKLYCQEYCKLLSLKTKTKITPSLAGNVIRTRIHSSLRKGPLRCTALIGGLSTKGPELMCVDPYGALFHDNFIATGYGLYFLYGIYDSYYKKAMSEDEGLELIRLCLKALKERMIIESDKWNLVVMDRENYRVESIDL